MTSRTGFTLIELSIVLVIIGLIVGGVLVGHDLITAAGVRAQVSQIEKYHQATNTFRMKYGYLPGDIRASAATQFGFVTRGAYAGQGDGNGIIEGTDSNAAGHNHGAYQNMGETGTFWVDLSTARLVDGSFSSVGPNWSGGYISTATTPTFNAFMPSGKIGQGNVISVWSGGWSLFSSNPDGYNYFAITVPDTLSSTGQFYSAPGLTVRQAYNIDQKIDDELPQSGRVIALYPYNGTVYWAAGGGGAGMGNVGTGTWPAGGPDTAATAASSITCYDNSNVNGRVQRYSIATNNGAGMNCALSFRFQ